VVEQKEKHMNIGKFYPDNNGGKVEGYHGDIFGCCEWRDLASVRISPVPAKQGNGPDYTVTAEPQICEGKFEIGAAWRKTSKAGKAYLSVKLDNPTFAAPINCALIPQADGSFALVWNRRDEANEQAAA
jgi:uncharacterized protein (DUF736 family)